MKSQRVAVMSIFALGVICWHLFYPSIEFFESTLPPCGQLFLQLPRSIITKVESGPHSDGYHRNSRDLGC